MKKTIGFLTLAVIAVFFVNISSAFADKVFYPVETLELEIIYPENIADIGETSWQEIRQKAERKITSASFKLPAKSESGGEKQLSTHDRVTFHIDILKIDEQDKIVFHSGAFFSKNMPAQRIILWKNQSPLKMAESPNVQTEIEETILNQLDSFLKLCVFTPAVKVTKDSGDEEGQGSFVSSKNSRIFHKSDCSSAKRINSENKIFYDSRSKAIEDGKRPCKRCEP